MGTGDNLRMEEIMGIYDHHEESENDYFQLNVSGKMIDFRVSHEYNLPEACFHPNDKESAIESIHKYFLDFFGDSVEYIWRAKYSEEFIPNLPNLSLWIQIWPRIQEVIDMKALENFFTSSPVKKHIHIRWNRLEVLSPESKFYQTESVRIVELYSHAVHALLRHFQGRQAILFFCDVEISDLIEFINRWRFGEVCQNLEYLKIIDGPTNLTEVLNVNVVKHLNATKMPPTHTVPNVYTPGRIFKANTDPITSHFYIVRETDNRVASISIEGESFCFGVWKETEEEFLRMVK